MSCRVENGEDRLPAWLHGLASDNSENWAQCRGELEAYVHVHGDPHCGFRDQDDRKLARWCKKQRASHKNGTLSAENTSALLAIGFQFEEEAAEWCRWYNELRLFRREHGFTDSGPFTAEVDIYLTNWCSVQRIAKRVGVMGSDRVSLLDELDFDWTGADLLS